MSSVAELVLAVVLMPAAGYALIGARWAAHRLDEARSKAPPPVPVERVPLEY